MGTAREELSGSRTTHRGPAAWPPVHAQSSEEGCPLCRGPWLQERSQVPWAKSATFSVPQREVLLLVNLDLTKCEPHDLSCLLANFTL